MCLVLGPGPLPMFSTQTTVCVYKSGLFPHWRIEIMSPASPFGNIDWHVSWVISCYSVSYQEHWFYSMDFGGIPGLYQLDADGVPSPQQRFRVFPDVDKRPCEEYGPDRRELRGQKAVLHSQTHQVQVPTVTWEATWTFIPQFWHHYNGKNNIATTGGWREEFHKANEVASKILRLCNFASTMIFTRIDINSPILQKRE